MSGRISGSAEMLLAQLGELSSRLAEMNPADEGYFLAPLAIIHEALGFHVSVLYRISNLIESDLLLEVIHVYSPQHERPDLKTGAKFCFDLNHPPAHFINEVEAFCSRAVKAKNVPDWGCDLVGYVAMPESSGHGYLLAGDFFAEETQVDAHEIRVFEIMCNLLSALLMKAQFEQLAIYDSLTGMLNSRAIRLELDQHLQRHRRRKGGLTAVVLCDIDHFKKINDGYGHLQGDAVLQEVGQLFNTALRKHSDVGGRFGGEEFLLIYDDFDRERIVDIVDRLRAGIEAHPFARLGSDGIALEGEYLTVTMSFGVALLEENSEERAVEILARADAALYRSKEDGRNRVTLAEA